MTKTIKTHIQLNEKLNEALEKLYRQGFIDGMKTFAHWKDGVQYVGTSGMKLNEAIEEIPNLTYYNPKAYFSTGEKKN